MTQRQRRRRDQRRRQGQRRGPSKRHVAAGASIAMGATLAAAGSAQAATLTVTNLNDTGAGSLRQAILTANGNGGGSDDIVFASGLSGTINVGSTSPFGIYPESPMNIQGDGRITLHGGPNVDYVVFTSANPSYGASAGDPITLAGLTITGGKATGKHGVVRGGGIYNVNAGLTVSNSVISGNHANDDGGGIYTGSALGRLTVVNSTVSGNTAGSAGDNYAGAIYSQDSPVVIRNSTISGNTGGGDGGAIYMSDRASASPSLTIENSTIANNASIAHSSDDEGGGVWICCGDGGQRLDIKGSTITGNSVGGPGGFGGGVYAALNTADQVTVNNTILANNHGTTGNDLYLQQGGQVAFSLIKDQANSTNPPATLVFTGPNITGQDPQLSALANNGGPTQTEALAPTSPAVDKGASFGLGSDQRGVLRPIDFPAIPNAAGGNGSDIGAFELQPDNGIKLGKVKRNKNKGTAKQVVLVPLPDAGTLTISGKGLKTKTRSVADTGTVKLPVIAKGKKRRQESQAGRVKVKPKITYTPTGGTPKTLKRKLKLLKRLGG